MSKPESSRQRRPVHQVQAPAMRMFLNAFTFLVCVTASASAQRFRPVPEGQVALMSQLAANAPPRSETVAVWRGDSLVIGTWLDLDEDLVSVELTFVNKSGNPVPLDFSNVFLLDEHRMALRRLTADEASDGILGTITEAPPPRTEPRYRVELEQDSYSGRTEGRITPERNSGGNPWMALSRGMLQGMAANRAAGRRAWAADVRRAGLRQNETVPPRAMLSGRLYFLAQDAGPFLLSAGAFNLRFEPPARGK